MIPLRTQALFWGASLPFRQAFRRARGYAADAKHRLRRLLGRTPIERVAVRVAPRRPPHEPPSLRLSGAGSNPVTPLEEACRLVAYTEDLAVVEAYPLQSAAAEAPIRCSHRSTGRGDFLGKSLTYPSFNQVKHPPPFPFSEAAGYWAPPTGDSGRRWTVELQDPFIGLGHLAPVDGPPTVFFLLPFLAVGGAERLLFDLIDGLGEAYRCVVVTVEPHRPSLGQTIDRCLERTPWVFPLGDWLPRPAHLGAVSHLLRRLAGQTLVSWNGTVFFFDEVAALRRRFPELRILSQLYHFEGGWTARTSPAVVRAVDVHIAVNSPIRESLVRRLKVPEDRVETIYHGVALPEAEAPEAFRARRETLRRHLGIPTDAVVIGTFIRLHPQKRPLDILDLARRFSVISSSSGHPASADKPSAEVWFLLMGGGSLDQEVDEQLRHRPIPRFVRLPMQAEPLPYYDVVDLCLMTSDYEGLPVFLLDGMARGLPGVAPSVGDIPELFRSGGGIACGRPGDLDALESALRRLIEPQERARAGRAARETVEQRFGLAPYCRAYEQVFFPERIPS